MTVTSGTSTVGNCDNLFVGTNAGAANTTGCNNVALGPQALAANRTGRNNVAVGESAGFSSTGIENTFVGYKSGLATTVGNFNTYFGSQAGMSNTTGDYNLFMGASTGYANTSGIYNTFVGNGAGYSNQIGSNNTLLGLNSGFKTTGSDNVMVGGTTGFENTGGSQNTFVGSGAGVSASNQNLVNATALGFRALVSTSNSVVLGNAANVGIGTSAPTAKLELVSGSVGTSGLKLTNLTSLSPATLRASKFLSVDDAGNVVLASTASGAREGDTDTTEALWQRSGQFLRSSDGNAVVIGNRISKTPSGYKLFVEEGILTEKVKVALKNASDWSDYVFAPGYRLKPLAEVAAYIRANKHLPGIPSADQVVQEGLDLGKMNAKLLEKVEELTLYTIQLEQTNQKQQQELELLKQKQAQVEQLLQELIKRK
ncbi:DUF3450 domain-containing protein [Spirosoma agri]|uniref:DUF3450 domain-containing protein n=1 Tax=Spirosoma agri TaxID=1987381 RepID=A0A6M0IE87_9BACT|nr:DUF3450 domain-containing protein [Spirosoma agri]